MGQNDSAVAERALGAVTADTALKANILDTLGWTLLKLGMYAEAEKRFWQSIKIAPLPATRLHLAEALIGRQHPQAAREQINLAQQDAERDNDSQALDEVDRLRKVIGPDSMRPEEGTP